jgi:hypothetical protein
MSFDNIRLPALAIADLYKQSLVVLDDVQTKAKKLTKKIVDASANDLQTVQNVSSVEVNQNEGAVTEPAVVKPAIRYLGGFKQKVSVVISDKAHEHINNADLEFLKKMMAACKLTIDDMAIINVENNQPAAKQLWQLMPAKAVLMFDVATDSIGIPFYQPDFKVQNWDSAKFMNAPSLATFRGPDTHELKTLKRELWEGLQKIFLGK